MDAVEFLKAFNKMCNLNCVETCITCPLKEECCDLTSEYCNPGKVVSIVEQWAKEHPVKTRQSEFLKMFPTAELMENGVINVCPAVVDSMERDKEGNRCKNITKSCFDCKRTYWMQEVE